MKRRTDKHQYFVGIDIAKREHVARCIDHCAQEHGKRCTFTQNQIGFDQFFAWLLTLGDRDSIVIGMEATGSYWCILHSRLIADGWTVEVINPILTSKMSRQSIRGRKSDASDARVIAKCVRDADYTPASIPSPEMNDLKSLTRARGDIVQQQTAIRIHINTCLDILFPEWQEALNDCQCTSFLALLAHAPSAVRIAALNISDIHALLKKHSRGSWGLKKARDIHQCASRSLARSTSTVTDEAVLCLHLQNLKNTQELCKQLEKNIKELCARVDSPLREMPYAGDVSHAIIIAEFGDALRFLIPVLNNAGEMVSNSGQMLAFAGLDPRIRQSGKWLGLVKMTKRGNGALRSALLRVADSARKKDPYFAAIFNKHKLKNKPHYVCLSHVARKYIDGLYRMMKLGDTFDWDIFTQVSCTEAQAVA